MHYNLSTENYNLSLEDEVLLKANGPLLSPVFNQLSPVVENITKTQTGLSWKQEGLSSIELNLIHHPENNAIDIQCHFTTDRDLVLSELNILPISTELNFYKCVNYRNRHATEQTWPELLLKGMETTTYSNDWQFAPHPSMMLFTKNNLSLFVGALDLSASYGIKANIQDYKVKGFCLDFGGEQWGKTLKKGETFHSPTFRFFLRDNKNPYEVFTEFGNMLIQENYISNPSDKKRESWWHAPLYCTWIDQVFESEVHLTTELNEQTAETAHPTRAVFNETLVRKAVEIIKREKLPFKTILLDEGWHIGRGHWEPHTERFPNMRQLVDDLHADGFKVVIWWNWCEIEKSVEKYMNPEHLVLNGKVNKHGCLMRDYSKKSTQEEYLKPLFHQLFSSDEGCYDFDGIKTDFQADKIHPEMPWEDNTWHGEEMTFLKIYQLFYTEMKKHKRDAVHIGGAGHYYLSEYIDINRTYDVFNSDYRQHEERAKMLFSTNPGCPVAYDFHNFTENLKEYLESAKEIGASVQIGNIIKTKKDYFSESELASSEYYQLLREHL